MLFQFLKNQKIFYNFILDNIFAYLLLFDILLSVRG
jgi:hypothetical protein